MATVAERKSPPIFDLRGVGFRRSGRDILSEVDWRIAAGERWAVLGPNGCGKSTLLHLAIGILWPTSGSIRRLGESFVDLPSFRSRIGWITDAVASQVPADEPARMTVLSGIFGQVGLRLFPGMSVTGADHENAAALLERLDCGPLADRAFGLLSQGERRKVLVARALIARPLCLVLDEPCAGMDPGGRERFLAWLGELLRRPGGPATILVTHHIEEILPEFGSTLVLRQGRVLASGPTPEVLRHETLEALYATRLDRLEHAGGRLWPIWDGSRRRMPDD
jgi:iron complex transport system ATP-binding protein